MLNLLEGLLLTNIDNNSMSVNQVSELLEASIPIEEFSQLFSGFSSEQISPDDLRRALNQFMREDGSIDVDRLTAVMNQKGQIIATQEAKTTPLNQEKSNVGHGVSITGEQQATVKSQLNETQSEINQGIELIQSQISFDVETSVEAGLDHQSDSNKKQHPIIQKWSLDSNKAISNDKVQPSISPPNITHSENISPSVFEKFNAHFNSSSEQGVESLNFSQLLTPESPQVNPTVTVNATAKASSNQVEFAPSVFKAHPISIATHTTQSDWADAFGDKIIWLTNQTVKSASLQVNPQELGPIEIQVKLNQEQASIQFNSHHVHTKEIIEQAMPRLREMMSEQGLNLVDIDVSTNTSSSKQEHAEAPEPGNLGEPRQEHPEQALISPITGNKPQGLVDFFA